MLKRHEVLALLIAGGAAVYALPLLAAEPEKTGLPQLDMSFYAGQLFWLAVTFAILYLLMAKIALPGVHRVQETRLQTIEAELAAAAKANEEAKVTMLSYERALADARAKAQATVNEIKIAAAKTSAEQQTAQEKLLSQRLHDAEAKINAARDIAIRDASASASELAQLIVERVSGTKTAVQA